MTYFKTGQRWISQMEPELGLGIVKSADNRRVVIHFPASETERIYASASAPLKRVEFKVGDVVQSQRGESFTVTAISEEDGILVYQGKSGKMPESELSYTISFTTPLDRLLSRLPDNNRDFNLRYQTLLNRLYARRSEIRGFMGGRIDLIPHQLYVAHQVTSQKIPRVLLSDETGLGKTIEACLILHRLLNSERIARVLIVVPPSLVHQWFVELLRRFNLLFRIVDQEYCESVVSSDAGLNPFLENQLCLCSLEFLTGFPNWKENAVAAGWDMLVFDEAHHLTENSRGYTLAKQLSAASAGLLLLTATPEQLGLRSHFLRLQLIDPARYFDFDRFKQEETKYQKVSGIIKILAENRNVSNQDETLLLNILPEEFDNQGENAATTLKNNPQKSRHLIKILLDRFGTGRAVFRNTRANISGFPERVAHLIQLEGAENDLKQESIEFATKLSADSEEPDYNFDGDPRIKWLAQFLLKQKNEKVLLICRSKEKVKAIEGALRKKVRIDIAIFHEGLTILQRDRNAGWFARQEGALLLICSEIGSEGRNFQFCQHLVLFDLPLDPELLEQRIGRLDRIGQTRKIHIYVPFISGCESEFLAKWFHEGLNAFQKNVAGVYQIYRKLRDELNEICRSRQKSRFEKFLSKTQSEKKRVAKIVKEGRDYLQELNSFNLEVAEKLIREIKTSDQKRDLEKYMLEAFREYGIREDLVSPQSYRLNLALLASPEFPLPVFQQDILTVTFNRQNALHHEDIEFLTWDHPMVTGAMELILGSEKGNCATASLRHSATNEILLEAMFVLECVAPKSIFVDRFLPPTPLRVVVNHSLKDLSEKFTSNHLSKLLINMPDLSILENPHLRGELIPNMLKECEALAKNNSVEIIEGSIEKMESVLETEIGRLIRLRKVNRNIRAEDISLLKEEEKLLRKAIASARVRLDSLRLIAPTGPTEAI